MRFAWSPAAHLPRRRLPAALSVASLLVTGATAAAQELPEAPLDRGTTLSLVADGPPSEPPDPTLFQSLFTGPGFVIPPAAHPAWQERGQDTVRPRAANAASASRWNAQDPPPPSAPPATGIKAVFRETWRDFTAFPQRRSTWAILAIAGGAAAAAHPLDDDANARLGGSDAAATFFAPGKWIGAVYVQGGVAAGLYVVGRWAIPHTSDAPKTNKVSHLGFDMLRALAVSQALTQGMKVTIRRDRPTGECCAFPSGHSSASFATAAVLERHLGYRAWPTFLVASYVAMSRVHDNRHYVSDVIFGAGLGIATGWTVVGRHGRSTYALTPVPIKGGMLLTFTRHPGGSVSNR